MTMAGRSQNRNDPFYQDSLVAYTMQGEFERNIYTVVQVNAIAGTVSDKTYLPVEISIVAFSLNQGIHDTLTLLIDPGQRRFGAFNAKVLADDTGLPQPGSNLFQQHHRDYKAMSSKIVNFIDHYMCVQEEEYPKRVLFGIMSDMEEVMGGFKWLEGQCQDTDLSARLKSLEFADLSRLFYRMAKFVNYRIKTYISPMIQFQLLRLAENQLNRAVHYMYSPQISCSYHREVATDKLDKCTKNSILRRVFIILEEFVTELGIPKCRSHFLSGGICADTGAFGNDNENWRNPVYPPQATAAGSCPRYLSATSGGTGSTFMN